MCTEIHTHTCRQTHTRKDKHISILHPTFAGGLDADWLETSIEGGGINDVRIKVTVVLPVDEERHDDRDNQAHDHRYDDTHIQSDIICTGGHWRTRGTKDKKKNGLLRSHEFTSTAFFLRVQGL